MSKYKVTPLHLGDVYRAKYRMIDGYTGEEKENFPINGYYLEGEHKILVDTGACSPESEQGQKVQPFTQTEEQKTDNALRAIGVEPADIDVIILTHLHWDHDSNLELFPNAKVYVQKREYDILSHPEHPSREKGYAKDVKEYIDQFDLVLVDGDQELFDGIRVVLTPGHSFGSQSVVVELEEYGTAIITGDLVCMQESWHYEPPRGNLLYYNDEGRIYLYESIGKIMHISKNILPGHDKSVFLEGMGFIR